MTWLHKNTIGIGGLKNVGYAPGQELLMVLSSQGMGIFNCTTGEKIARLRNGDDWYDSFNDADNTINGFDCLQDIIIRTSGLDGDDRLPKASSDDWKLILSDPEPDYSPFERYLVQPIHLLSPHNKEKTLITKNGVCELRAFGFSDTGKSFIVATSCDLTIYSRES